MTSFKPSPGYKTKRAFAIFSSTVSYLLHSPISGPCSHSLRLGSIPGWVLHADG